MLFSVLFPCPVILCGVGIGTHSRAELQLVMSPRWDHLPCSYLAFLIQHLPEIPPSCVAQFCFFPFVGAVLFHRGHVRSHGPLSFWEGAPQSFQLAPVNHAVYDSYTVASSAGRLK